MDQVHLENTSTNRDNLDDFIARFPIEIVSQIFVAFANTSDLRYEKTYDSDHRIYRWMPVLVLGEVCRRWRDVTLSIPQLWADVTINPWDDASPEWLGLTAEWLSRSRGYPLSLTIRNPPVRRQTGRLLDESSFRALPSTFPDPVIRLLRSYAHRWKRLNVRTIAQLIHDLLNGLENLPPMDSLTMYPTDDTLTPFLVAGHVQTKELSLSRISVNKIRFIWNSLTSFNVETMRMGEILHVLRNATNLKTSIITNVLPNIQPTNPITPVVHHSLTTLATNRPCFTDNYLRYLTLPALKTLHYSTEQQDNEETMEVLTAFISRSQPSLNFSLEYMVYSNDGVEDWYSKPQSIAALHFTLFVFENTTNKAEHLLQALASSTEPLLFPCLRDLRIITGTQNVSRGCWSAICDMFPSNTMAKLRPLNSVLIFLHPISYDDELTRIDEDLYLRICEIRKSGVYFNITHNQGGGYLRDVLAYCEELYSRTRRDYDEDGGQR